MAEHFVQNVVTRSALVPVVLFALTMGPYFVLGGFCPPGFDTYACYGGNKRAMPRVDDDAAARRATDELILNLLRKYQQEARRGRLSTSGADGAPSPQTTDDRSPSVDADAARVIPELSGDAVYKPYRPPMLAPLGEQLKRVDNELDELLDAKRSIQVERAAGADNDDDAPAADDAVKVIPDVGDQPYRPFRPPSPPPPPKSAGDDLDALLDAARPLSAVGNVADQAVPVDDKKKTVDAGETRVLLNRAQLDQLNEQLRMLAERLRHEERSEESMERQDGRRRFVRRRR